MRFLPLSDADRTEMMQAIGIKDIEELFLDIPMEARSKAITDIDLPIGIPEIKVMNSLKSLAKQNITVEDYVSFLGCGAYKHYIPSIVNYLIERGEFLTSYTPYQPEVAQGTLKAMFDFQTQVARITGMDTANASMYDGASATAEAVAMALRITKKKKILLSGKIHPYYLETIKTFIANLEVEIETLAFNPYEKEDLISKITPDTAAVVVQNPDVTGAVASYSSLSDKCKETKTLFIITSAEPLAYGVIKNPGEIGADIVCAEGMYLAGKLNFGGASLGLFAAKKEYVRQMPGRLVGKTVDKNGKEGYVLTLATREQHIRRDKATSNICSNAGLVALAFSIHLALLGTKGYKNLATLNHAKAVELYLELKNIPKVKVLNDTFFNEFIIELPIPSKDFLKNALEHKIFGGVALSQFYENYDNLLLVTVTECTRSKDMAKLIKLLKEL